MFCNHCGTRLNPGARFCQKCGNVVVVESGCGYVQSPTERQFHTLGIVWMIVGVLTLFPSLVFLGFEHGFRLAARGPEFWHPFPFMIFGGFFLFSAAAFLVGWGLVNRESWARTAAIIAGVVFLCHPPFGTLLGLYTLWVLLSERRAARMARY